MRHDNSTDLTRTITATTIIVRSTYRDTYINNPINKSGYEPQLVLYMYLDAYRCSSQISGSQIYIAYLTVKTVYALGPRGQIPTWAVGLRETKTPGAGGAKLKDLRGALEQRSLVERVFV